MPVPIEHFVGDLIPHLLLDWVVYVHFIVCHVTLLRVILYTSWVEALPHTSPHSPAVDNFVGDLTPYDYVLTVVVCCCLTA